MYSSRVVQIFTLIFAISTATAVPMPSIDDIQAGLETRDSCTGGTA